MTVNGPDDNNLEQALAEARRSYNVPPERAPLDAMWATIERDTMGGRLRARSRAPFGHRLSWIGVAAALVAGVGIGRLTYPAADDSARQTASEPERRATGESYDRATLRYLGQTAALLVSLPVEARPGPADRRFLARAAELLTTTRLLLDSPAAADPKVRELLEDVELVLAQVTHLEVDRGRVEFDLIAQAVEQRDLLPRLTSAAAGNTEADD